MGLDMYLSAEKYISDWDHNRPLVAGQRSNDSNPEWAGVTAAVGQPGWRCEGSPGGTVSLTVAYWRKANQIHKWFVDNVQGGTDDCDEHDVSREQLIELRDLCVKVLASTTTHEGVVRNGQRFNRETGEWEDILEDGQVMTEPAVAQEHLPTESGFFFGGTDYDEWYYLDLKDTVRQIDTILERFPDTGDWLSNWAFKYRSSW